MYFLKSTVGCVSTHGRRLYTATCGIWAKWPSGKRTPLYNIKLNVIVFKIFDQVLWLKLDFKQEKWNLLDQISVDSMVQIDHWSKMVYFSKNDVAICGENIKTLMDHV